VYHGVTEKSGRRSRQFYFGTVVQCANNIPNALVSQSFTPPDTESKLVCGEYTAILFSRHVATIRS
jgi:hypothetical protein